MGPAREAFDRLNAALLTGDLETVAASYAADAVAVTPDEGEIKGRDSIVAYRRTFVEAFSDMGFDFLYTHDAGNCAVDKGWLTGRHTGPLHGPNGEIIPPTGRPFASGSATPSQSRTG